MTTSTRHERRTMIGIVHSAKGHKTISVEVQRTYKHAKYGKYLRKRKRYLAHDEKNEAQPGDEVLIASTRPLSRSKRWRLLQIVAKSRLGGIEGGGEATAEVMAELTGKPAEEEAR